MPTIDDQPADRVRIPRVGYVAPDFLLSNASHEERHLAAMVEEQPTILVFYRGHW